MTDKNKKQILDDVKLKHDYYKIERVYSIKLTKSFILVLLTPIEISKGQRRRNFLKAKKLFKSALF